MNTKNTIKKIAAMTLAALAFGFATSAWAMTEAATITNVKAQQRYPWNGKFDIEYTASGVDADCQARHVTAVLKVMAVDHDTHTTNIAESAYLSGDTTMADGTHKLVWDLDAQKDFQGLVSENFEILISCEVAAGVQLWMGGPYFAECNVGATQPEESGYYFWWGDTVGYKRNANNDGWISVEDGSAHRFEYTATACPTYGEYSSYADLQKFGYIDDANNPFLNAAHDAATVHCGAPWRMVQREEMQALVENCETTWTTRNNAYGQLITGKGAYATKSIFIPASGYADMYNLLGANVNGYYWSASASSRAWQLYVDSHGVYSVNGSHASSVGSASWGMDRPGGGTVRPVRSSSAPLPVLCMAESGAVRANLQTGKTREAAAEEALAYSAAWDGGETVTIAVNGKSAFQASGSGTYDWTPSVDGLNTLTHTVVANGTPVVQTARFYHGPTATIPSAPTEVANATFKVYVNGVESAGGMVQSNRAATVVYTAANGYCFADRSTVRVYDLDTTRNPAVNLTTPSEPIVKDVAPVIATPAAGISVNGNAKVLLPVSIYDEDGAAVTTTLSGTGATAFTVEDGKIYYTGGKFTGSDKVYSLTVTASNGAKATVQNLSITVKANRPPVINVSGLSINAARRTVGNYIIPISFGDPDGDAITIAVSGNANFSVSDGTLYFKATNANTNSTGTRGYTITLTVTDASGAVTEQKVTVSVKVINGTLLASNFYVFDLQREYGTRLIDCVRSGADVEGTIFAIRGRDGRTYSADDILPVGKHALTFVFSPNDISYRCEERKFGGYSFDDCVTIRPRTITLSSDSASKDYDGTPLTDGTVTVDGGLIGNDTFCYADLASQTEVGTVANTYTVVAGPGTDLNNYNIIKTCGTLTVNKQQVDPVVTLTPAIAEYEPGMTFPSVAVTSAGRMTPHDPVTDYVLTWDSESIVEPEPGTTNEYTAVVTMTGDYAGTATAVFKVWKALPEGYDVTFAASAHGTVTTDWTEKVPEGETVTLTATPEAGYAFDSLEVYKADDPTTKVTVTDGAFTMPAYTVMVSATFAAVDQAITKEEMLHGTVSVPASAKTGALVTLTVTPDEGCVLDTVTVTAANGDVIELDDGNAFIMPAGGVTIAATFTELLAITDVKAQQRYPWNGKVDITYTVKGEAEGGETLTVMASNTVDGTVYTATSAALIGTLDLTPGTHALVWDLDAQGLQLKTSSILFGLTVSGGMQNLMADGKMEVKRGGWNRDGMRSTGMINTDDSSTTSVYNSVLYTWYTGAANGLFKLKSNSVYVYTFVDPDPATTAWTAKSGFLQADASVFTNLEKQECATVTLGTTTKSEAQIQADYDKNKQWSTTGYNVSCKQKAGFDGVGWYDKTTKRTVMIFTTGNEDSYLGLNFRMNGGSGFATASDEIRAAATQSILNSELYRLGDSDGTKTAQALREAGIADVLTSDASAGSAGEILSVYSDEVAVDTLGGSREAAASETIRFSPAWETEEAGATAVVTIDGVEASKSAETGAYVWTPKPKLGGLVEMTHQVFIDGVQAGATLTASFTVPEPPTYDVTIAAADHGKVTADRTEKILEGEPVSLTVTPDAGYELDTLTVTAANGDVIELDDGNAFTMPADGVSVAATFKAKAYAITGAAAEDGAVIVPKTAATDETVTLKLNTLDFVLTADTLKVTADGENVALTKVDTDTYTFTMPAGAVQVDATYTAIVTQPVLQTEGGEEQLTIPADWRETYKLRNSQVTNVTQKLDNGMTAWQSYVLGRDPTNVLSGIYADVEQDDKTDTVTIEAVGLDENTIVPGFGLTYRLEKTEEPGFLKENAVSPEFDVGIAAAEEDPTGHYKLSMVVTKDGTPVEGAVEAINTVGIVRQTQAATNAIISVPWSRLAPGQDQEIQVSEVVKTANLDEGDELRVYRPGSSTYESYTLDANRQWVAAKTFKVAALGSGSQSDAPEAPAATITRGSGIWLCRKDPSKPYFLYGQSNGADESKVTVVQGPNLIGATGTGDYDLNEHILNAEPGDVIVVPGTGSAPLRFEFKGGKWGHQKSEKMTIVFGGTEYSTFRNVWSTDDAKVPAGTGFWLYNNSGNITVK